MPRKAPSTAKAKPVKPDQQPGSVTFHYIKSNFFRVIHIDGAISGLTPQMGIHLGLFNERPAIPQQAEYRLADGGLGEELKDKRVSKSGIVRELEVDMMLSETTAKALIQLLGEKLQLLAKLREERGNEDAVEG